MRHTDQKIKYQQSQWPYGIQSNKWRQECCDHDSDGWGNTPTLTRQLLGAPLVLHNTGIRLLHPCFSPHIIIIILEITCWMLSDPFILHFTSTINTVHSKAHTVHEQKYDPVLIKLGVVKHLQSWGKLRGLEIHATVIQCFTSKQNVLEIHSEATHWGGKSTKIWNMSFYHIVTKSTSSLNHIIHNKY